ncbi:hypothetical protein AAMO2058_001193400 [Amorphochlora amoebiformis]
MSKNSECVQVCVRLRPLNSKEKSDKRKQVVFINPDRAEVVVRSASGTEEKRFFYDFAFPPTISQEEVFDLTARPIIDSVMKGYNGTIFAYGQTGTGKTWTMEGNHKDDKLKGIIPRSFQQIFIAIETMGEDKQFLVHGSFLEIYNNCVYDLLNDHKVNGAGLPLKEQRDGRKTTIFVKGLTKRVCKNPQELYKILKEGTTRRAVASTNMNRSSSRSHSIFTCIVEQCPKDNPSAIKVGKLNMVDLAGSERAMKTGAKGDTLKEANAINMSLSALGNVISALTVKRIKHVPYRNSKLTRLLQDSLGGNTKTTMLAALGPADYNWDETISTLRFAKRAKAITNKPTVNMNPKDALLMDMQAEIDRLRKQLSDMNQGGGIGGDAFGRRPAKLSPVRRKKVVEKVVEKVVRRGVTKEEIEEARKLAQLKVLKESKEMKDHIQRLQSSAENAGKVKEALNQKVAKVDEVLTTKQQIREEVMQKLNNIQGQLVVGEKLKLQVQKDKLAIEKKKQMLKAKLLEERKMKVALQRQEQELSQKEEKFASKEQEVDSKTKKLDKLRGMYKEITIEIEDVQAEIQHERENMLQTIRELSRSLKLKDIVLDNFIPRSQLQSFSKRCYWDEDTDEWKLGDVDVKTESLTARPKSQKQGFLQPKSEYSRLSAYLGDSNARFKGYNIMEMSLLEPKRTTTDYEEVNEDNDEYAEGQYMHDDYGDQVAGGYEDVPY